MKGQLSALLLAISIGLHTNSGLAGLIEKDDVLTPLGDSRGLSQDKIIQLKSAESIELAGVIENEGRGLIDEYGPKMGLTAEQIRHRHPSV